MLKRLGCLVGFHHTGVLVRTRGFDKIRCTTCGTLGIRHEMFTIYEIGDSGDPVFEEKGKWFFHGTDLVKNLKGSIHGPYATESIARTNLNQYVKLINGESCGRQDADNG